MTAKEDLLKNQIAALEKRIATLEKQQTMHKEAMRLLVELVEEMNAARD